MAQNSVHSMSSSCLVFFPVHCSEVNGKCEAFECEAYKKNEIVIQEKHSNGIKLFISQISTLRNFWNCSQPLVDGVREINSFDESAEILLADATYISLFFFHPTFQSTRS